MTYRDDHDAAIARAESLEREVHELERERDELRAKLAVAEHPPAQQSMALLAPMPREVAPLSEAELQHLLEVLETGAVQERRGGWFRVGFSIPILALAAYGVLARLPELAIGASIPGVTLFVGSLLERYEKAPDKWRPVLVAIRDEPERIVSIEAEDSRGLLAISTTRHTLRLRTASRATIANLVARRCPYAALKAESP